MIKKVEIDKYLFAYIRTYMEKGNNEKLKELLSHVHKWPAHYNFKFIYKSDPQIFQQLKSLFPTDTEFKLKHSNKKNYESLNVTYLAKSADEVLNLNKKVSEIEGVIAL